MATTPVQASAAACAHSVDAPLHLAERQELAEFVRLKAEQLERVWDVGGGPSSPPAFQLMLDNDLHARNSAALRSISPHVEVRAALGQRVLLATWSPTQQLPCGRSGEVGRVPLH